MITYNHESFIRQAVDSVLAQDVDAEWELVVGEDCSTDKTGSILDEYAKEYPRRLRLLRRPVNMGMMDNLLTTLSACRGEYIAFLEGDDYWCDVRKVHKQMAILDSDRSLSMTYSAMWKLKDGVFTLWSWGEDRKNRYKLGDLLRGSLGYTLTFMYRKVFQANYPSWVRCAQMGDWVLHTLQACHGDALYLDEPTAVYRIHAGGVSSGKSRIGRCCMDERTNVLLLRNLPGEVPRGDLSARLERTRRDIVYYGLVYRDGVLQGLRALLLLLASGRWPFRTMRDVARACLSLLPGAAWSVRKWRNRQRKST